MRALLDSHILLWALFDPERLSGNARQIIEHPGNAVFVSSVSFWELSLKHGLGKLELRGVTPDVFPQAVVDMGLDILPLSASDAATFHQLPRQAHKDPFDRMLVWQAIRQACVLITCDRALDAYYAPNGLRTVW